MFQAGVRARAAAAGGRRARVAGLLAELVRCRLLRGGRFWRLHHRAALQQGIRGRAISYSLRQLNHSFIHPWQK